MNTFIEKDNNTFWGQYTDIEQSHIKNINQLIKKDRTHILDPIKEEDNDDNDDNEEKKDEDNQCCYYNKILYYQLCVVIITIITIFMI